MPHLLRGGEGRPNARGLPAGSTPALQVSLPSKDSYSCRQNALSVSRRVMHSCTSWKRASIFGGSIERRQYSGTACEENQTLRRADRLVWVDYKAQRCQHLLDSVQLCLALFLGVAADEDVVREVHNHDALGRQNLTDLCHEGVHVSRKRLVLRPALPCTMTDVKGRTVWCA